MIYAFLSIFIIIPTVSCCNATGELRQTDGCSSISKTSCRMFYIAYLYAYVETTTEVKNFLWSRGGGRRGRRIDDDPSYDGCGDEEKSRVWWRGEEAKGTMVESLCRNKGGTISRMRSTFSTNAGSQAVKQIRPSYIRGVSVIPRARLWPPSPSPSITEEECCGVKSTSLLIRMEVMCCIGSETLSWHPAGNRFS